MVSQLQHSEEQGSTMEATLLVEVWVSQLQGCELGTVTSTHLSCGAMGRGEMSSPSISMTVVGSFRPRTAGSLQHRAAPACLGRVPVRAQSQWCSRYQVPQTRPVVLCNKSMIVKMHGKRYLLRDSLCHTAASGMRFSPSSFFFLSFILGRGRWVG